MQVQRYVTFSLLDLNPLLQLPGEDIYLLRKHGQHRNKLLFALGQIFLQELDRHVPLPLIYIYIYPYHACTTFSQLLKPCYLRRTA